jgi:hypothetical protein
MGTKRQGDKCYEKAELDEPIFVLRAQDCTAPEVVEFWIKLNPQIEFTEKMYEAQRLADAMRAWQDRKLAD